MQRSFKSASESSLVTINSDYSRYIDEYLTNNNHKMVQFLINTFEKKIVWDYNLLNNLLSKNFFFNIKNIIKNISINTLEKIITKNMSSGINQNKYKDILTKELVERFKIESIQNDDPCIFLKILKFDPKAIECPIFRKEINDKQLPNLSSFYSSETHFLLTNEMYEMIKGIPIEILDSYFDQHPNMFELKDKHHNNLFHYSVIDNNYALVEYFLKKDLNLLNQKNIWFLTPLNEAVRLGHHKIANLLRENGAFCHHISDSKQSIIGIRHDFFNKLELIMDISKDIFVDIDFVFQLFHSVLDNEHLYNCSLGSYTFSLSNFYENSMNLVFHKNNPTFFKNSINIINRCNDISQDKFFLSPLCKDYDIQSLITFPFMIGKTFLGYFFLWTKNSMQKEEVLNFFNFISYFIDSNYTKSIQIFPHLCKKIILLEKCIIFYTENLKDLKSSSSRKFYKALKNIIPLLDFPDFNYYDYQVLYTLFECHIPFTKISSDCFNDLTIISDRYPLDKIIPSHLYQQMTALSYNNHSSLGKIWDKKPVLLTSFDLFEIIGSHHDQSYNSRLNEINELIQNKCLSPRSIFEKCASIILNEENFVYRTTPVLGVETMNHYIIFLPYYEIEKALDHVFKLFHINDFIPSLSDIFLICVKLLEWIHPLKDGNGRTVRLFISIYLRSYGIPIIYEYRPINSLSFFISFLKKLIKD